MTASDWRAGLCRAIGVVLLCLAMVPVGAKADGKPVRGIKVTPDGFEFDPSRNGFGETGVAREVWSPSTHVSETAPFLFMSGDPNPFYACSFAGKSLARNCDSAKTQSCFAALNDAAMSKLLTGLSAGQILWPQCPDGTAGGDSFAAWEPGGGIALYTHTGQSLFDPSRPAFMQTRTHAVGGNKVHGNYVHFPAGTVSVNSKTRPFFGASACKAGNSFTACISKHRMQVELTMNVHLVDLANPGGQQALQKLGVILRNQATDNVAHRIHITPRVFCRGKGCDSPSTINVDPNQGGANFVSGPIGGQGSDTVAQVKYKGTLHQGAVWTSTGSDRTRSQAPTGRMDMRFEISWAQFVRTLRLATYRGGMDGSNNANVAKFFGDGWSVPNNWVLRDVRVGQEIMNNNWSCSPSGTPCSGRTVARMGGYVANIRISPVVR